MTGIVLPCPWCGSVDLSWSLPAYSRVLKPYCVECEATGPRIAVVDRSDKAECNAAAIEAWNGARQ